MYLHVDVHENDKTFSFSCVEFEKQRLGAIRPLEEMMEGSHLHGNEDQWKALCETRFGLTVNFAKSAHSLPLHDSV